MHWFSAIPFCMWRLSDESMYISSYCVSDVRTLPRLISLIFPESWFASCGNHRTRTINHFLLHLKLKEPPKIQPIYYFLYSSGYTVYLKERPWIPHLHLN